MSADELAEADLRSDAEYEQLASSHGPLRPESVYRKAKWAIGEIDRLRADQPIVEAAVAYVAAHTGPVSLSKDTEKAQAMVELIRTVRGRERGE